MKLFIVESPAKAKTISKYLDDDSYVVRASIGHVRDLPKSNKKAIDIEGGFVPHYEITKGKEHVIEELHELAEKADEVVLATDPDREGEAIAWHIKEEVGLKNPKRIVFHEITKDAIDEAMRNPRVIDDNLRRAQEARRVLDRLVGYDLSGLIWKKVRYGLSAGRVQSPALRILMEREREIRAFVPEHYFVITADTKTKKDGKLLLTCTEEPRDEKEKDRILETGKKASWSIADIKETNMKRSARAPFITSTLQQAASTRLGFAPARTMGVAQKLYEAGHITYMRTDSTSIAGAAQNQIIALVKKEFGNDYLTPRSYKTKSRNAQEAHEAIRPTTVSRKNAGTTDDQKKLYRLIWERAVSSQMADAKLLKTKIIARADLSARDAAGKPAASRAQAGIPDFAANGSRMQFDGWLKVDTAARGEDVELPEVQTDEALVLVDIHAEGKDTQPPSRYTEAGLIKELERRGIGRPSTYASIMKTLADREYVIKEGKTLFPTDTGEVVSTFLEDNFKKYISDSFTAEMEDELDDIANGEREYTKTLKAFYDPFLEDVKSKEDTAKATDLGDAPEEFRCPKCDSNMVIKLGRGGKFMSCSKFPECDGARTIDGEELKPQEPIGIHPETGEDIYVLTGRFGPYVQLGAPKAKKDRASKEKPRRAGIPKDIDPNSITVAQAVKLLSLPRELGTHPETGNPIIANIGRFGPYIGHERDFRSLKTDDVYTITLERALEIFKEPKKTRGFKKKSEK